MARGGKERKAALQTALIKTLPGEKQNATVSHSGLNDP